MKSLFESKIDNMKNEHDDYINKKAKEFETNLRIKTNECDEIVSRNTRELEKKISNFETNWIPISQHEEIVNAEMERLENEYQQQLRTIYSQATTQVETRAREQLEHIKHEKEKIEAADFLNAYDK